MRSALLLIVALSAGCRPFYRDDTARLARARDRAALERLATDGDAALAAGRPADAARSYQALIERNPEVGGELFLALARAQAKAGQRAAARATVGFALERRRGAESGLRALRVELDAGDGRVADALDGLSSLDEAERYSSLRREVGGLLEAQRLAAEGRVQPALDRYAAWLASYGVPDHPLLERARSSVLEAARSRTALLVHDARDRRGAGALLLLALAYRYLPPERFQSELGEALVVAARDGDAVAAPEADRAAARAEEELAAGRLGSATHQLRIAVAAAPWRAELHRDLALLEAKLGRGDVAARELAWAERLAPSSGAELTPLRAAVAAIQGQGPERRARIETELRASRRSARRRLAGGIALALVAAVGGGVAALFAALSSDGVDPSLRTAEANASSGFAISSALIAGGAAVLIITGLVAPAMPER